MKHLDFPVSAAAVHLHGREFHDQDFFVAAPPPAASNDAAAADDALPQPGQSHADQRHPPFAYPSQTGDGVRKLLRWTLTCVGLAFAAALLLSWLVRPDVNQAKWIDSATSHSAPTAR